MKPENSETLCTITDKSMTQHKHTAGMILLLTILVINSKLLYAAGGAPASEAYGGQANISEYNATANPLPAQTSVGATAAKGPPPGKDWTVRIGAGTILSPTFVGASSYQLLVVPTLKVTYRDTFFASVEDGIGYAVILQNGWRAGPVARFAFGRKENGDNPFRVAGTKSTALHGLGNVDPTLEAGGFAEYKWRRITGKIGLRKGLDGHEGLVSNLAANYTHTSQALSPMVGSPLVASIGPRLTVVDATYNKAFFGVNAKQAANSGLPPHSPGGGILSYGVGSVIIVPAGKQLSAVFLAGYDRLSGDAGSSPLVTERGSRNQWLVGLLLNYEFSGK